MGRLVPAGTGLEHYKRQAGGQGNKAKNVLDKPVPVG